MTHVQKMAATYTRLSLQQNMTRNVLVIFDLIFSSTNEACENIYLLSAL